MYTQCYGLKVVEPSWCMCISGLGLEEHTACFMEARACGGAVPTTAKQEAESKALAACSSILPYHRRTPQKPWIKISSFSFILFPSGILSAARHKLLMYRTWYMLCITLFMLHVTRERKGAIVSEHTLGNLELKDGDPDCGIPGLGVCEIPTPALWLSPLA